MIEKTQTHITLSPFKKDFWQELVITLVVVIGVAIAGYFMKLNNELYLWLGVFALGYTLYHLFFWTYKKIIFDLIHQEIFIKNLWGSRKILSFHEATLLLQSNNYGSQSYHLAKKSDRYQSLGRISGYLSESELLEFENEVVNQILPLLDNPKTGMLNNQNTLTSPFNQ